MALEEGRPVAHDPLPTPAREPCRLDDDELTARLRAMSIGERLECGFELCGFASELAGAAAPR